MFMIISCAINNNSLMEELADAKKKIKDEYVPETEITFLKATIPRLEAEIKEKKEIIRGLLEDPYYEIDHHSQWYLMGESVVGH
jgi:predicted RNase H-like nuclease (RuvC/YqgF family)